MTRDENGVMEDAYYFLRNHDDPPSRGSLGEMPYWEKAVNDMIAVVNKWNSHPLAVEIMVGVFNYLEEKARRRR